MLVSVKRLENIHRVDQVFASPNGAVLGVGKVSSQSLVDFSILNDIDDSEWFDLDEDLISFDQPYLQTEIALGSSFINIPKFFMKTTENISIRTNIPSAACFYLLDQAKSLWLSNECEMLDHCYYFPVDIQNSYLEAKFTQHSDLELESTGLIYEDFCNLVELGCQKCGFSFDIKKFRKIAKQFSGKGNKRVIQFDKFGQDKFVRNKFISISRKNHLDSCDLELECTDGISLQVHQAVLQSRSSYFSTMFTSDIQVSASTIPFNAPSFLCSAFIDYLYLKKSPSNNFDSNQIKQLILVSDQYLTNSLTRKCEQILVSRLTLKNVAEISNLAWSINEAHQSLLISCFEFIYANLVELIESDLLNILNTDLLLSFDDYFRKRTGKSDSFVNLNQNDPRDCSVQEEKTELFDYEVDVYQAAGLLNGKTQEEAELLQQSLWDSIKSSNPKSPAVETNNTTLSPQQFPSLSSTTSPPKRSTNTNSPKRKFQKATNKQKREREQQALEQQRRKQLETDTRKNQPVWGEAEEINSKSLKEIQSEEKCTSKPTWVTTGQDTFVNADGNLANVLQEESLSIQNQCKEELESLLRRKFACNSESISITFS